MSGHNKWSTIKHKKGAADAKRGKMFSKLIKEISIAARMGGGDLDGNPRLRTAVTTARAANMPKENIDRAIKRGTGEIEGVTYEEMTYEGYGHGGVAILVEALTDNRNRTAAEVRKACHRYAEFYWNAGLMNREIANGRIVILENYLAPSDFTVNDPHGKEVHVKECTWLQGRGYRDNAIWAMVKSGELSGLSMGGSAIRKPTAK